MKNRTLYLILSYIDLVLTITMLVCAIFLLAVVSAVGECLVLPPALPILMVITTIIGFAIHLVKCSLFEKRIKAKAQETKKEE